MDYGYLSASKSSHQDFTTVLRNFQAFYGLKKNGILDSSTFSLMKKPRCGVPDQSGSKLQKRYSTEIPWRIRDLTYYVQPGADLPAVSTINTEYGNREGGLQMCKIHIFPKALEPLGNVNLT